MLKYLGVYCRCNAMGDLQVVQQKEKKRVLYLYIETETDREEGKDKNRDRECQSVTKMCKIFTFLSTFL